MNSTSRIIPAEDDRGLPRFRRGYSGTGIEEPKMEHLFEAGWPGLGLSISHYILQSHGGQLWAKDNGGQGSTFMFTLPADIGGVIKRG